MFRFLYRVCHKMKYLQQIVMKTKICHPSIVDAMEVLTSLLKKGKYCITRLKRLKHLSAISKAYQKESLLQDLQ